jgi:SAM-dependent methyltransferase
VPAVRQTSFRGNAVLAPFHAVDQHHDFIIDYINETGPYDAIIELGCGYGRNLFEIFYRGGPLGAKYYGGELTESGVSIAAELAALEREMDATFFQFDHLAPDLSHLPKFDRALVFTAHSFEQVGLMDPVVFSVMAGVGRQVSGLHFEPFGFQFQLLGPMSKIHAKMAQDNGWNQNFAAALREAEALYGIKIIYVATEMFHPVDPANPTSLAIWTTPVEKAVAGS